MQLQDKQNEFYNLKLSKMNWYMNIYYNFKGYPIVGDSSTDKPNELRSLYSNMLKQYLKCFEIKTDLDSAYNNNENNQSTILLQINQHQDQTKMYKFEQISNIKVKDIEDRLCQKIMLKAIGIELKRLVIQSKTEQVFAKEHLPFQIQIQKYPASVEELKFQFLKYCVKTKTCASSTIQQLNNADSTNSMTDQDEQDSFTNQDSSIRRQIGKTQIEQLIFQASKSQTNAYNQLLELYLKTNCTKFSNYRSQIDSLFSQLGITTNLINFDANSAVQQQPTTDLKHSNILLSTWFDLIFTKQSPWKLLEIVQQLVRTSPSSTNQLQQHIFYDKLMAYWHLMMLSTSKNLFIRSLCKLNHLTTLFDSATTCSDQSQSSLTQHLEQFSSECFQILRNEKIISYVDLPVIIEQQSRKIIWKQEAMISLLQIWKAIGQILTETCFEDSNANLAIIFQGYLTLLDRQLDAFLRLIHKIAYELVDVHGQKNNTLLRIMIDILKIILGKRDIDTKSIFTQATLAASSEHWKKTIEENILICEQLLLLIDNLQNSFKNHQDHQETTTLCFAEIFKQISYLKMEFPQLKMSLVLRRLRTSLELMRKQILKNVEQELRVIVKGNCRQLNWQFIERKIIYFNLIKFNKHLSETIVTSYQISGEKEQKAKQISTKSYYQSPLLNDELVFIKLHHIEMMEGGTSEDKLHLTFLAQFQKHRQQINNINFFILLLNDSQKQSNSVRKLKQSSIQPRLTETQSIDLKQKRKQSQKNSQRSYTDFSQSSQMNIETTKNMIELLSMRNSELKVLIQYFSNLQKYLKMMSEHTFEQYDNPFNKNLQIKILDQFQTHTSKFNSQSPKSESQYFLKSMQVWPKYYQTLARIVKVQSFIAGVMAPTQVLHSVANNRELSPSVKQIVKLTGKKYISNIVQSMSKCEITDAAMISIEQLNTFYRGRIILVLIALMTAAYQPQSNNRSSLKDNRCFQFEKVDNEIVNGLSCYVDILKEYLVWRIKQNCKQVQGKTLSELHTVKVAFNVPEFLYEMLQINANVSRCDEQQLFIRLNDLIDKQKNQKIKELLSANINAVQEQLNLFDREQSRQQYLFKKLVSLLNREIYFRLCYENSFLQRKQTNSKRNFAIYQSRIDEFYSEIIQINVKQHFACRQEQKRKRSVHVCNYQYKYVQEPKTNKVDQHVNKLNCCLFNQILSIFTVNQKTLKLKNGKKHAALAFQDNQLYKYYFSTPFLKLEELFSDSAAKKGKGLTVLIYTLDGFAASSAMKINHKFRESLLYKSAQDLCNHLTKSRNQLSDEQIELLRNNEKSIATIFKTEIMKQIKTERDVMMRTNFIAKIEKLYINLAVSRKVFDNYKQKILDYELQKVKISHQYTDYINGLKLDVYAHMAGQTATKYLKILDEIKSCRLKAKAKVLQQRINREFQKNLRKWNIRIIQNFENYNKWIDNESKVENKLYSKSVENCNQLGNVYSTVIKLHKDIKNSCNKPENQYKIVANEKPITQMAANIQKGMKLDQIKTQKRPQISNPINKNVPSTILKKTTNKKQTQKSYPNLLTRK